MDAARALGLEREPPDCAKRLRSSALDSPALRELHGAYHAAAAAANAAARRRLQELCADLEPRLPALAAAANFRVLMHALLLHAEHGLQLGWTLPELEGGGGGGGGEAADSSGEAAAAAGADKGDKAGADEPGPLVLQGLWPYWLDPRVGGDGAAVANDIELEGVALLTGPNMAGAFCSLRRAREGGRGREWSCPLRDLPLPPSVNWRPNTTTLIRTTHIHTRAQASRPCCARSAPPRCSPTAASSCPRAPRACRATTPSCCATSAVTRRASA